MEVSIEWMDGLRQVTMYCNGVDECPYASDDNGYEPEWENDCIYYNGQGCSNPECRVHYLRVVAKALRERAQAIKDNGEEEDEG